MSPTRYFVLCLLLLARPAFGQIIGIYPDQAGAGGCFEAHPGSLGELYVIVKDAPGYPQLSLTDVSFELPQLCGLFAVEYVPVFPSTVLPPGDLREVTVSFGECLPSPIHVLTLRVVSLDPPACCYSKVPGIDAGTCVGDRTPLASWELMLTDTLCHVVAPSNPNPINGATFVAQDAVLSWSKMYGPRYCNSIYWYHVFFGTDSNPPSATMTSHLSWDPPGSLAVNTTYYWRVSGFGDGGQALSPLWSFSTGEGPVEIEASTWGRIKALYR
ncbi:MAG TPA: hypothetical protein VF247_08485 [Candidatus Krumholzibacteria bacterium]